MNDLDKLVQGLEGARSTLEYSDWRSDAEAVQDAATALRAADAEIADLHDNLNRSVERTAEAFEERDSLRAAITAAREVVRTDPTDTAELGRILSAALSAPAPSKDASDQDPWWEQSAPAPVSQPSEAEPRPHSRACGWRIHAHGAECSTNCPTCHGRKEQN